MPPLLVRLGKRKTTWNGEVPPDEVVKIEFQDKATGKVDLQPSFYLLDAGAPRIVQAHAEHSASLMDRPVGAVHVDAHGIEARTPVHTPGETLFRFTRDEAHRELRFNSTAELTSFVGSILSDAARRHQTTSDQLTEYVGARLDAGDPEWVEACSWHDKAKRWPEHVVKLRRKKAKEAAANATGGGGHGGSNAQ